MYMLQVSTHGDLEHQIRVWKYPGLTQLVSLTAHSAGVLYMAVSPDGEAVVTGGGDETLHFWTMFSEPHSQNVSAQFICWGKIFFHGLHFFKMTFILTEIYNKYLS
jgi:WD40 repeat protein